MTAPHLKQRKEESGFDDKAPFEDGGGKNTQSTPERTVRLQGPEYCINYGGT